VAVLESELRRPDLEIVPAESELRHPDPEAAAEALEPEAGLLADADPIGFVDAITELAGGLARRPLAVSSVALRLGTELGLSGVATGLRALGVRVDGRIAPDRRDRRFKDPAWERYPWWFGIEQSYLLWSRSMLELLGAAKLDGPEKMKAEFAVRVMIDAVAPTNFLAGNPTALRRAAETNGRSVLAGMRNMTEDLLRNGGRPRQVDTAGFRVGENLAATPGKVVYRNRLMELIQYEPQTKTTYEIPLLLSPPWINKYYVMDLAPGRSFAEWAVKHGHTVFAISYRNPDATMRDVALDDYLLHGPHTALDVITNITGAPEVNVAGLCLGGTLTTMLLAHLAHEDKDRVRSATLLNTLIDFSEPGMLGSFTDPESVRRMAAKMAEKGVLEGKEMSLTFDLLRANDLIWNYVASGWLMGERPPAFDILAWNADSTRMPAAMHSFYLRHCYAENQLARGEMELAGSPLHLGEIPEQIYLLAAKEDHIVPWTASYKATQLFRSPVRFVLSSSGHIAGIVNPPNPKARHWTNDTTPADPEAWLACATEQPDSWWHDWADWIAERAGPRRDPPPIGSSEHQPLGDAPGTYVHER
jgi:poly[(R)-3-hydroxyalkanoate] polymerase subunit PhaC